MKLTTTLKNVILEQVALDLIQRSIKEKRIVVMYYDGDEPGGRGLRKVEPVCLGRSKGNNLVLRAWDFEGASHRDYTKVRPLPSWRLFRVDKIKTYNLTDDIFTEPRPNYNFNGDNSMISVIINAKFDNASNAA